MKGEYISILKYTVSIMIELKNVSKYYNNNGVVTLGLRNINLKLSKGEIVAITGESGSGKSTLLNVICGVDSYEEGEILFKGNETSYFNQNDMDVYRKKHVSFIYQNYNIIDSYTVLENVMLPLLITGMSSSDAKVRATELIEKVGLMHRIKNRGTQLSGGEKQRCVIARALASDCEILACDEPTGNLDSKTGEEIIRLIQEVAKDKLVLIVTHNYEQVEDIVTRTIKVSDGEIIEDDQRNDIQFEEEQGSLDLSSDRVKKKSIGEISLRNVRSTPKKTVFTLFVFIAFSAIALFLYLSCVQFREMEASSYESTYNNYLPNRIVVYNEDHSVMDPSKLSEIKGEMYTNAFYEDYSNMFIVYGGYALTYTISQYMPDGVQGIIGKTPENTGDAFFILPRSQVADSMNTVEGRVGSNFTVLNQSLTLTGCGYSDDLYQALCVVKGDFSSNFNASLFSDGYVDALSLEVDNETYTENLTMQTAVAGQKSHVIWKSAVEPTQTKASLTVNNMFTYELEVEWQSTTSETPSYEVVLGTDLSSIGVIETIVYADNVNQATKIIESAGYKYDIPASYGVVNQLEIFVYRLYLCLVTIALFLLTFVSYIVLSRVYASKNQDYTIMRSMGILKKDMARIVAIETIATGVMGNVLTVLMFYCVSIGNPYMKILLSYNSFGFMILYFVVMIIFEYIIARRFNKRLFKFTVRSTIHSEVSQHD